MADDGIHGIAARLERAEEQTLFVLQRALQAQVPRHRVFIKEVLRRLDQCHPGVTEKAGRPLKEIAGGNEIRVETHEQLALAQRQRMIQISRFGVPVVRAVEVAAVQFLRQLPHRRAPLIIKQVNGLARIIHRLAADDGAS